MIIRIPFLFILFLVSIISNSQTKAETENWIIEKLNKHSRFLNDNNKELNMYYNYTNYQFQLKDGFLTITCDVLFYMKNPSFERFGEIKSKEKKVLDIGEIKEVRCEANLVIVNNDGTRANIGFDCYTEENLEARLKKAFNHLKVFYPRKKKKEAF